MKKSDDSLRQAQEDVERRKRLLVFGKIRVDPEPTTKSPLKQKDEEKKAVTVNHVQSNGGGMGKRSRLTKVTLQIIVISVPSWLLLARSAVSCVIP